MSKLFEQLVAARGLDERFLRPRYEDAVDPYLLPDMNEAVARIEQAVAQGERCIIYGDYDVDGVTASTVLYNALKLAGVKELEVMLPNRFTDGYGMSNKIVQRAAETGATLVFTVDCGSRNHEIVAELGAQGIETVITDHHECEETLPEAVAVVNPKRKDVEVSPDLKELAGVGVAFKVAQALVKRGLIPVGQEKWLLDLVAIGTICDSMMLRGENRRLCRYGALVLGKTRRPGLRELMLNAGVKEVTGDAIGYQIGPRLNAAGRMDTAEKALKLLMAEKRTEAVALASELEALNAARKKQQNDAVKEISARGLSDDPVIVEEGNWHEGVLGIIAGRLTEEYKKPAFVLGEADGVMKGSGRSFGEFNLAEALEACKEYIIGGGGHAAACGVKLTKDKVGDFRKALNEYYRSLGLHDQERYLAVQEDLRVENFEDLSLELMEELRQLEPFGEGNRTPIFCLSDARVVDAARLGDDGQHLRLQLWDKNEHSFKAMWFYAPEEYLDIEAGSTVNVWATLEENEFRGIKNIEGRVVKLL